MEDLIRIIIVGLVIGSVYGLVGLTFTAIYNATKVINFAQGEFLMLGAVGAYFFLEHFRLPFGVSLVLVVVMVTIVGLILQRLFVTPLIERGAKVFPVIIGTVALAMMISGGAGIATEFRQLGVQPYGGSGLLNILGVAVTRQSIIFLVAAGLLVLSFWLIMKKTVAGMAIRAMGFNREMASLVGIQTTRMAALAFVLSASYASICGFLVAPMVPISSQMGFPLVIKGFIASILGGLGNPYGAMVGGLIVGLLGTFLTGYFSSAHSETVLVLILFAVLLIRPHGLFGEGE